MTLLDTTTAVLRLSLAEAFKRIAALPDRDTLSRAVEAKDAAAIYAAFGIAPDQVSWPAMEQAIDDALAATLAPLIDNTASDEQDALKTSLPAFTPDASTTTTETRDAIIAATLAGFLAVVPLLLATTSTTGAIVTRLAQSVGMTEKQATTFAITQQALDNLFNPIMAKAIDKLRPGTRSSLLSPAIKNLPPYVRKLIERMLQRAEGRPITPGDIEGVFTDLAKALVNYRTRADAELAANAAVNATLLAVWVAAQAVGVLPAGQLKYWHDRADDRVRVSHHQIEVMNLAGVPLAEPFANPLGKTLQFPPAEHGCRCRVSLKPPQLGRVGA